MTAPSACGRARALSLVAALCLALPSLLAQPQSAPAQLTKGSDFERMARQQAETDKRLAHRQRRADADGEDHLSQPRGRSRHPRVRVSAAEAARRQGSSRDRLGTREHPRPSLRALHSLHPRSDREGLHRHRAGVSRQHRLRPGVLRRDRLRRRRSRRCGDGGGRAEDEILRRSIPAGSASSAGATAG